MSIDETLNRQATVPNANEYVFFFLIKKKTVEVPLESISIENNRITHFYDCYVGLSLVYR